VSEVLLRHETRLGRIERDFGEMKSDLVMLENQILSRMNGIFNVTRMIEEHGDRLAHIEALSRTQA
jgi:hypothetical protein